MAESHKVFVSYHHSNDQEYRDTFERLFSIYYNIFISKSVQIGEIATNLTTDTLRQIIRVKYLRDTTVTIVLIGAETWQRKHVDWEISSSIRQTEHSSRSGLMGIILPTHTSYGDSTYYKGIVPPRLANNQTCGYSKIYHWSNDPSSITRWIETAFQNRFKVDPVNSYLHFVNNKSGARWT